MTVLHAENVSKSFFPEGQAATRVLRNVTFSCKRGEFVAVMGPSGAGKSTLLHILASLDTVDEGTIQLVTDQVYCYQNLTPRKLATMRNRYLGIVYQFHHLLPEFSAIENVMMPMLIAGKPKAEAHKRAHTLLEHVGLLHRTEYHPLRLSGGEQQRVAIARALANAPAVLLADEPTGNLDTDNANQIVALFSSLQNEYNVSIIVATHSIELAHHANRIVRLQDGTIVE